MAPAATAPAPTKRVRRHFLADGDPNSGGTSPNLYGPIAYPTNVNPISYNPVDINSSSAPVQAAASQRQWTAGQGDVLQGADTNLANQYAQQAYGVQNYLNPIEENLASGGGGYNPSETSQIELTPQQQQDITTKAGISAGAGTASAVGAAERAAAAAGGSPAALATYRARAAQTEGANAGDAMTGARIAAQQAGSAGAQAVGNARLNQQQQGSQYLGNLQAQKDTASQNEQGLAQGAYGTETNATGQATGQQIAATELPTIADKIAGTAAGIAGALADGRPAIKNAPGYLDDGMDAVIGEDGPEAVIEAGRPHMADGGTMSPLDALNNDVAMRAISGGLNGYGQRPSVGSTWNKTTPWQQTGTAIGSLIHKSMAKKPAGAGPYNNTAADSTGTYTMPGQPPMPVHGGVGDDEMGSQSYLADGDTGDGSDSPDGSDPNSKTNPDGTLKKTVQKVTSPEQNLRNYLSDEMAEALRPPAPDPTFSLASGARPAVKVSGGLPGGGGTPSTGSVGTGTPAQGMPPVLTGVNLPSAGGTPPAPINTNSVWTTGDNALPNLNPPLADVPGPDPLVPDVNSAFLNKASFIPPAERDPRTPVDPGTPPDSGVPPGVVVSGLVPDNNSNGDPLHDTINLPDPGTGGTTLPPPDYGSSTIPPDPSTGTNAGGGAFTPDGGETQILPPDNTDGGNDLLPDNGLVDNGTNQLPDFTGGVISGPGYSQGGDSTPDYGWDSDIYMEADGGITPSMANGGMHPGFKWTERQGRQLHAPAGGYTPLNLRPKPMMADGGMNGRPMMADGGNVKVVNSPTRVKLAPGDQVVPLSFRPKAKIRPSAALPALQAATMRVRPMFGARQ